VLSGTQGIMAKTLHLELGSGLPLFTEFLESTFSET
jgi:hypothetical protein